MFKLIYAIQGVKHEVTADTLDEILSLSVAAYDDSADLIEILKDDEPLYHYMEIYELIMKAYY
jgi:hypothetical protein